MTSLNPLQSDLQTMRPMRRPVGWTDAVMGALMLIRFHLKKRLHNRVSTTLLISAWGLSLAVALQSAAAGRRFLSDTVIAVLFTLLLALLVSERLQPLRRKMHWTRSGQGAVPVEGE